MKWLSQGFIVLSAIGIVSLWTAGFGCRDIITTNDPKESFLNTTVTLIVTISPVNASGLVPGKSAIINFTIHDTNHYSGVTVLSSALAGINASDFTILGNAIFPLPIKAMDSATFQMRFTPVKLGYVSALLTVNPDSNNIGATDTMQYYVGVGSLSLRDTTINFGFVQTDSSLNKNIVITNTGLSPVRIHNIYYAGSDSGSFGYRVTPDLSCPFTIQPAGTFTFQLQFNPFSQGAYSTSLIIAADSLPAVFMYLTGIGANNGMALQPDPILFAYHDSSEAQTIAYDTLYDFNLDTNYRHVDSIKVQSNQGDSALFTVIGNFPVTIPPPMGPDPANGTMYPVAIIRFNGVPAVAAHYGYLQVYFREAPGVPVLVPLVAGPF